MPGWFSGGLFTPLGELKGLTLFLGAIPTHCGAPVACFCPHDCGRAARAVPFPVGLGGCT
eukprot:1831465-Lingulodinium_polyedra.AAC.1